MTKATTRSASSAVDSSSTDSIEQTEWAPLLHVSDIPLVTAIRPDATDASVKYLLSVKLTHLEAMLMATYGESGESFRAWNDLLQDNFMWSCAELATECRALFSALGSKGDAA